MAMNCDEFKDLAPVWAVGALDDGERAACAAHLAACDPAQGCHASHRDARLLAERLADAAPEHPVAPRVWNAIEDRVRAEAQGAAVRPSLFSLPGPPGRGLG